MSELNTKELVLILVSVLFVLWLTALVVLLATMRVI
jgi:hypothetical protein